MKQFAKLRDEISTIDKEILALFAKRFRLVQEVGAYKKVHNLPIQDAEREKQLISALSEEAEKLGISATLISRVWHEIFSESYRIEK